MNFSTIGPYVGHYPTCTVTPSSEIEKQIERATVSELALLLWRNTFVAQIENLPAGEIFSNNRTLTFERLIIN